MTSIGDEADPFMSQEDPAIVSQVHAEPVDDYLLGGPSLAEFIAEHGDLDELDDNFQNSQQSEAPVPATSTVGETETQSTTHPPPPKRKKILTFANKKILGDRHLFLQPQFMNQFVDDNVILQRKIIKCATKKDRLSRYIVDWKKPYPQGLNPTWLKKEHENTDVQRVING